ncbi:hypothetical protein THRCLA_01793 [Thraustotheca clavata]|uniref:Uncharacterized protein n=1 Tax=Thraustotheca clavata TaxID=74557 RepID=A0A1W0A796_9STRA|nr:hypothetical protein THRCLA_01793 [Thraustotheca clavata]
MFAHTHSTLSNDVLRVIESIMMEAPEDHAVHYMKGLQQIRGYMTKFHTGSDGSSLSFEDMVQKWNGEWQEHVDKAKSSPIAMATERAMLPFMEGLSGIDIRVAARGRPDDAIYNGDEYARRYYPRGNYVAKWNLGNKVVYFPMVRAYPKFTGHEDDGELLNEENDTSSVASEALSKYFTKPATNTKTVISTTKENGEAAHLAVLKKTDGSFVYLVGSKNVHMAIQSISDIEKAIAVGSAPGQNPFAGARPVAFGILRMLEKLSPAKRNIFCEFLWQTRLTASFELLCPNHQHVELLDVSEDTPVLFGFSFSTLNSMPGIEICMNPLLGYALAQFCGVRTVAFDIVAYTGNEFKNVLSAIKSGYQTEGKVNLYIDNEGCVIGLQKFKTAWYVSLRAIREKSKSFLTSVLGKKKKLQVPDALALSHKQLYKRFGAIAKWLQLPKDKADQYCELGTAFISYIANVRLAACDGNPTAQKSVQHEVTDLFPIVWRDFLTTSELSDRIDCK